MRCSSDRPSINCLSLSASIWERERRRMIVLSWKWKGKDWDGTLESQMQGKIRGSSTESTTGKHDSWCLEEDGESSVTFPPTHAIETSRNGFGFLREREVCKCFCREKGVGVMVGKESKGPLFTCHSISGKRKENVPHTRPVLMKIRGMVVILWVGPQYFEIINHRNRCTAFNYH